MGKDKLDLLKNLSDLGGDDAINAFKLYIPDHYAEVYSLYELLDDANVDYGNIKFHKPQESGDDAFIFLCNFDDVDDIQTLQSYLESMDNHVHYLRHKTYKVTITEKLSCIAIKFKRT